MRAAGRPSGRVGNWAQREWQGCTAREVPPIQLDLSAVLRGSAEERRASANMMFNLLVAMRTLRDFIAQTGLGRMARG